MQTSSNAGRFSRVLSWILRIGIAVIFLQTLFFKFSGAKESIAIFTQMGMEPWGRYGLGILELIASIFILIPRTLVWGALLSAGMMAGAILSHLLRIGIVIDNDGGLLFGLAALVFISSLMVLVLHRLEIFALLNHFKLGKKKS